MILPEETYPAIDIYKMLKFLILRDEKQQISIGDFVIIDVNDKDEYDKHHIISALHYDRRLLCRNYFETEVIAQGKYREKTLIIYGNSSGNTTSALIQRGYSAIQLQGNIEQYKQVVPIGLCSPEMQTFDIYALKAALEHKKNAPRGERLWRSTSATRLKSSQSKSRINQSTPTVKRQPWRF